MSERINMHLNLICKYVSKLVINAMLEGKLLSYFKSIVMFSYQNISILVWSHSTVIVNFQNFTKLKFNSNLNSSLAGMSWLCVNQRTVTTHSTKLNCWSIFQVILPTNYVSYSCWGLSINDIQIVYLNLTKFVIRRYGCFVQIVDSAIANNH